MRKNKIVVLLLLTAILALSFAFAACTIPAPATHTCGNVCETCKKCTDATCTNAACKDKCPGHGDASGHVCGHKCSVCGGCLDADCNEEACWDKCGAATLARAVENVKNQYGSVENTSAEQELINVTSIRDSHTNTTIKYTISWKIEVAEGVTAHAQIEVSENGTITLKVDELDMQDHPYTLIATITDPSNNTEAIRFNVKVPATQAITVKEFVAKEKGDALYKVEGWVTAVNKVGEAGSFVLADETGAVFSYTSGDVELGKKYSVVATRSDFNGFPQLGTTSVTKINTTETFEPTATELAAATILSNPPKDDIPGYTGKLLKITGSILVKSGDYLICNYNGTQVLNLYMNSDLRTEADKLVDNEVVVYGYARGVGNYLTVQLTAIEKAEVREKTDAEKVADAKATVKVDDIFAAGDVTLPETSGDVAISWTLAETTLATLEGTKLTVAALPVEASTITLTATLTCGDVTDTKEITVNITPLSVISIADFLAKSKGDELFAIEGWCVAANKVGEAGSFVLADETGAVFSYKNGNVEVGKKYKVYGTRADNYGLPQIGTTNVVPVETSETFVEPDATELAAADINLSALSAETITAYTGKYYKITGITAAKSGNFVNGNYNGAQLLSLWMNDTLKATATTMDGKEVVVYGYVRGFKANTYLTIQVVGIELAGGTDTPPSHTCEHVCATCGKCTDTTCTDAACKDKCQGHDEPVVGNDGTSIEKAYSVAEIISATSSLEKGAYTENMLFVKGIVVSFSSGNFVQNLYLADASGNTETFLVYSANFTDDVKSIAVGDTIVVKGAVKNYEGTIEMASVTVNKQTVHGYPTIVALVSAGQGTIAVASGSSEHATVAVTNNQTEGTNHTTFTFTVTVDDEHEIVSVTVDGSEVEPENGLYTGTILGATTIYVETKEKGAAEPVLVATLDFTAQGYDNAAAVSSLTVSGYTVTFDKGTNSNATKWYNSGSALRAYAGNTFTVSGTGIVKIVITYGTGDGSNEITADCGSFNSNTWIGNAESVKFTISGTSGNRRITKIEIYSLPATVEE